MNEIEIKDRRKFTRYRGNPGVRVSIEADWGENTTGMILNISRAGAYIMAGTMEFNKGIVTFILPDGGTVTCGCLLVDGGHKGGETMGIAFVSELTDKELNLLIADGYED